MQSTFIRLHLSNGQRAILAASLFAVSSGSHAHTFCVATAQLFQDALTQSSNGGVYNGEDNDIYMVGGTYHTGPATGHAPFFYYSPSSTHAIKITGGYAAGCSAGTPQTPPTTLDGGGNTGVLTIRNSHGNVIVQQLTLQNGESTEPGAGLQVNYLVTVNASVLIRKNIIRNNHSSVDAGGLYASGDSRLSVISNLIADNSTDTNYGGAYLTGFGLPSLVYNNTVTQNFASTTTATVGGLYFGGGAVVDILNNIFWNNNSIGLYLGNSSANLVFNAYGTLGGSAPAATFGNFVKVNPKFVNASGGDFHLIGISPLHGVSTELVTYDDLDGNLYPQSGKVDLGVYEDTIFIDGLDGG